MEYGDYLPSGFPQAPLPPFEQPFGQLFELLYCGYMGQTFGPLSAKRHICHNLLNYVEEVEHFVIHQDLLRPDVSYPGLPGTFSIPHSRYPHLRCNSVGADGSYRIILDCYIADHTTRVVPQSLFAPYAGRPRSQTELQSTTLLPPIFFIQVDHSVGLPLGTAKSVADLRRPLLQYDGWTPMQGKASTKLRIVVRYPLICSQFSLTGSIFAVAGLQSMGNTNPVAKSQKGTYYAPAAGATCRQWGGPFSAGKFVSFFGHTYTSLIFQSNSMNMGLLSIHHFPSGELVMVPTRSLHPVSSWLVWWRSLRAASCQSCGSQIRGICTIFFISFPVH
jgi:hypothetical protein